MDNFKNKNTKIYDMENFNLNREMEIYKTSNKNILLLDDRDLFNKFSNGNEQIDISNNNNIEENFGMPIFNGQILNNKKSLLSNPYIQEDNNKNNFISNNINCNSMFEQIETEKKNKDDYFTNMAYNNNNSSISNYICKIEKDIIEFEYELNREKINKFVVEINSPFILGYLWKTILLLSKNPSSDKLLKLLGIKNKEIVVTDLKNHSEILSDFGTIEYIFPVTNQTVNTNFINKIQEIYNLNIKTEYNDNNLLKIISKFNIELEIPNYYNPKIVIDYMENYKENKFKFIELTDIPISITNENNIIIIEILLESNMILGFIFDNKNKNIEILPYELMLKEKNMNVKVKKLVIPKLNKNKILDYGKRYTNELQNIHLGEIIYGTLYNLDIKIMVGLTISTVQSSNKPLINKDINEIEFYKINHNCFFFIKNLNIPNKILLSGIINY